MRLRLLNYLVHSILVHKWIGFLVSVAHFIVVFVFYFMFDWTGAFRRCCINFFYIWIHDGKRAINLYSEDDIYNTIIIRTKKQQQQQESQMNTIDHRAMKDSSRETNWKEITHLANRQKPFILLKKYYLVNEYRRTKESIFL